MILRIVMVSMNIGKTAKKETKFAVYEMWTEKIAVNAGVCVSR